MPRLELDTANRREFRKLVIAITAQPQQLGLLLAVCDDRNLQARLIDDYEAELKDAGIGTYRTRLSHERPSLKAALLELVERESALQTGGPAVVTVLNAGELLGVRLTEEKSEQEKFFFSLQWTREALLQFNFPIVLWLPDDVATRLAQRAPDFWSWRSGVFEFAAAPPDFLAADHPDDQQPLLMSEAEEPTDTDSQIPIADLEQQIATLTETSPESPLLITLRNTLGDAYQREYRYQKAMEQYRQALSHAETHQDKAGQARSLLKLADSLKAFGRPAQAILYYQEALALYRQLEDANGEAATLNQLGLVCSVLGQYRQAVDFHQQSFKIARAVEDRQGEANSLNNLGNVYFSLGQYQQAIKFHQQHLEIARETGNLQGEANALGNLGNVYFSLGQYQQAIDFLQRTLKIARQMGDRQTEAGALGNLGNAYDALSQYQRAIDFHQQSLKIEREISNRRGESDSLGGMGLSYSLLGQYQQAIDLLQQSQEIKREINDPLGEANVLLNKALALEKLSRVSEARSHYEAAKAIFSELGLQDLVEQCEAAIQALEA